MKYSRIVCLFAILFGIASCAQLKLQEAQSGLDAAIEQLPRPAGFDVVTVKSWTTSMTAGGKTCYYAEAYIVFGTSLSAKDALALYVDELGPSEWVLKDTMQYAHSRLLVRGDFERAEVRYGEYGVWSAQDPAYSRALEIYPTVILVRLMYILPARDGC